MNERARQPAERGAPQSGVRSAQVSRTLREVLSAFATAEIADDLVHEALADAGLARLPEGAETLRGFVEVELRHAVTATLGADAGEAMVRGLEPMLSVLANMDRRGAPTVRTTLVAPAMPRVGVVTGDVRLTARLRVALGGGHELTRYESLSAVTREGRTLPSLVLDCRSVGRGPDLSVAGASAREALVRTDVLLMFAGVAERSALRSACPQAGVIVCSSRDVSDVELSDLLATFLGTK